MMPNAVGAGVSDPRPALRQPLAQLRQSSVGDRLKATISPMAGTPRVSRWRLPDHEHEGHADPHGGRRAQRARREHARHARDRGRPAP